MATAMVASTVSLIWPPPQSLAMSGPPIALSYDLKLVTSTQNSSPRYDRIRSRYLTLLTTAAAGDEERVVVAGARIQALIVRGKGHVDRA